MLVKVVGLESVNYKSKNTGRDVSGFRIHYVESAEISADRGSGSRVRNDFVSSSVFLAQTVAVGGEYELSYNRYGNVEKIEVAH